MTRVRSYRDLKVWQKAIILVKHVYTLADQFPKKETYGLQSQLCRAVISIAANIAEGSSRQSTKEFIRYINIAFGSLAETETHSIIAQELGYISAAQSGEVLALTDEIHRMLNALRTKLEQRVSGMAEESAPFFVEHLDSSTLELLDS